MRPNNRLEALKGDREGQHSIRINDQWRVCFRWTAQGPTDVEIVDASSDAPGEMLREEFLEPLGLTPYAVAKACGVPRTRIERIAREELGISADTALRLARFFGTSAEFWLNLQTRYDMLTAERAIARDLKRIEPLKRDAA